MKKANKIIAILAVWIICFFLGFCSKTVFAANECTNVSITNQQGVFVLSATCEQGNYVIQVNEEYIGNINSPADNSPVSFTIPTANLAAGSYTVDIITQFGDIVASPTLNIEPGQVVTLLSCGMTCSPNSTGCPASCPCINVSGSWSCSGTGFGGNGVVSTAIGDIDTRDPSIFIGLLTRILVGMGGGIAFLLMLFGSFKIILSAGNPESVKAGQEMITSAISGLFFIIFSIFLLSFIGVKVFMLPGFV